MRGKYVDRDAEIVRLFKTGSLNNREIGDLVGITRESVRVVLKRNGYQNHPHPKTATPRES